MRCRSTALLALGVYLVSPLLPPLHPEGLPRDISLQATLVSRRGSGEPSGPSFTILWLRSSLEDRDEQEATEGWGRWREAEAVGVCAAF